MKKTMSLITAIAMLASSMSALNAFAAEEAAPSVEPTSEGNTIRDYSGWTQTDIDVSVDAGYKGTDDDTLAGSEAEEIEGSIVKKVNHESSPTIYVEVEWEEMKFIYDFGTVEDYVWDLTKYDYVPVYKYDRGEAAWNKDSATITFTNYSNRDVYTGVSFEINSQAGVYDNVEVSFDKEEVLLLSDVGKGFEGADSQDIEMFVEGAPDAAIKDMETVPSLGALKFYISEETRIQPEAPAPEPAAETETGEHEHQYVYDQFGRLVCTGCNAIKHEYCIDMDEDGLCDECGLDRDFCADCHVGGKCICT